MDENDIKVVQGVIKLALLDYEIKENNKRFQESVERMDDWGNRFIGFSCGVFLMIVIWILSQTTI
jgi:hypothetical protein